MYNNVLVHSVNVAYMDSYELLKTLAEKGIISQGDGGVTLSDGFVSKVENKKLDVEESATSDIEDKLTSSPKLLASYLVLKEKVDFLSAAEIIQALTLTSHFYCDARENKYIPETFLCVPAEHLDSLLPLHRRVIVYIWEHDSRSCDIVRNDFEDLIDSWPENLVLFAVNKNEHSKFLDKNYDVTVAPTILFIVDGVVDARLIGAHSPSVISSEIGKLFELSS